ncbi:hypothetical protein F5B18DRAFT_597022 [Nemania serpens]|nr:hypothetical protein F5B18DRAFT_597022 [Nemania serpens]
MDDSLKSQAATFVGKLAVQCAAGLGLGSLSSSIYDTVWVSMIRVLHWLGSGDSLNVSNILETQFSTGAWPIYSSILDGILNTAVGLLALKKHWKIRRVAELMSRCRDAEKALRPTLESWDFQTSDQVGFELLVFEHLCLLRDEGIDIHLSSDWEKLSKIPLPRVYKTSSTLLHSL